MTPAKPVMLPPGLMYQADTLPRAIERMKGQFNAQEKLAASLALFLAKAFPSAEAEAGEVGIALTRLLNLGLPEEIAEMERIAATGPPEFPSYLKPYDATERLVDLCKRRDLLQEQIDGMEEMVSVLGSKTSGGKMDGFEEIIRAQIKASGFPKQLEELNNEISQLQREIESRAVPADGDSASQAASPEAE